jgi:hypothetical protein
VRSPRVLRLRGARVGREPVGLSPHSSLENQEFAGRALGPWRAVLFDSVDRNLCGERPFRLPVARLKCGVWLGGLGDLLPGL